MTACDEQGNELNNSLPTPSVSQLTNTPKSQQTDNLQQSNREGASVLEEDSEETESTGTKKKGSDILIVYFSATGTTKTLEEYVAEGDLYEIILEEPYTSENLNYSNDNSRNFIEQNDESAALQSPVVWRIWINMIWFFWAILK